MKLNKNTRDKVRVGTVLGDTCGRYLVTDIWTVNGRYTYLTAANMKTRQNIYGLPISQWYGCEIEEV